MTAERAVRERIISALDEAGYRVTDDIQDRIGDLIDALTAAGEHAAAVTATPDTALEWDRPDPGLATAPARRRPGRYEITRDGRTWDLELVDDGPAGGFLGNYLTLGDAQAEAQTYEDAAPNRQEPRP